MSPWLREERLATCCRRRKAVRRGYHVCRARKPIWSATAQTGPLELCWLDRHL